MHLKKFTHSLLLTTIIIFSGFSLYAQKAIYTTNGGMIIGFGLGASYQQSDIANSLGGGFDFQLGSWLYHKENAFLSVDWKFRFLAGENTAFDHRMNSDSTFSNIKYSFFDYDLELGLTLNRLRERTRILLGGFAGVGITHGRTFTDLYDANANLYDFSSIDPAQDRKTIHADLVSLSDNKFETALINRATIMPTLGIFLGYQFSHSFSISIEHKINFSLSENNGIFGIDMDNRVVPGSNRDMNHYTSLTFRWSLGRSSSSGYAGNVPEVVTSPVINESLIRDAANAKPIHPIPEDTVSHHVTTPRPRVRTNPPPPSRPVVSPTPVPQPSTVKPTPPPATQTDKPTTTTPVETGIPRPEVSFINPPTPVTVENNLFRIKAGTNHVNSWQDVDVYVNGKSNSNFSFTGDGMIHLNLALKEGVNTVEVVVENASGKAQANTSITYIPPVHVPRPVITRIVPATAQITTRENIQEIRAEIEGIAGSKDLSITLNRKPFTNFRYDPDKGELSFTVPLFIGTNNITIIAKNPSGTDTERISILRTELRCDPPEFSMIVPDRAETNTTRQEFQFKAEISGVSDRDQLKLTYNGNPVNDFSFEGNIFRYNTLLNEGKNIFNLTVTNACGSKNISRSVYYKPEPVELPCNQPEINVSLTESTRNGTTHIMSGTISNIDNAGGISLKVNGSQDSGFRFDPVSGQFSSSFDLRPGTYSIAIEARNDCGRDKKSFTVTVEAPCLDPSVDFRVTKGEEENSHYRLEGEIRQIQNRVGISVTVNNEPFSGFVYDAQSGRITGTFSWTPGNYTVQVKVSNACGSAVKTVQVTVAEPCREPEVKLDVNENPDNNYTHKLQGVVKNTPRSGISITLDGSTFNTFQFNAQSGLVSANLNLQPGQHKIILSAINDCGTDKASVVVKVEKEEETNCAVRINPGNADWQFCLVTPKGTFNRATLKNKNFSYAGPASSLFFSPIAGGGKASINGKPYTLNPGTYYLFRGKLNVQVSTKNKGAMGQWSVCITADRAPVSGKGNNRPKSPCEKNNSGNNSGKKQGNK